MKERIDYFELFKIFNFKKNKNTLHLQAMSRSSSVTGDTGESRKKERRKWRQICNLPQFQLNFSTLHTVMISSNSVMCLCLTASSSEAGDQKCCPRIARTCLVISSTSEPPFCEVPSPKQFVPFVAVPLETRQRRSC